MSAKTEARVRADAERTGNANIQSAKMDTDKIQAFVGMGGDWHKLTDNPVAFHKLREMSLAQVEDLKGTKKPLLQALLDFNPETGSIPDESVEEDPMTDGLAPHNPDIDDALIAAYEEGADEKSAENNGLPYDLLENGGRRVQLDYPVHCDKQGGDINYVTIRRANANDLGKWGNKFVRHQDLKRQANAPTVAKPSADAHVIQTVQLHFLRDPEVIRNCITDLNVEGLTYAEVGTIDVDSYKRLGVTVINFFGN